MAHVLGKQEWCGLSLHFTGHQPKKMHSSKNTAKRTRCRCLNLIILQNMSSGPAILLLLSKEDNDDSRGLQMAMLLEDLY